MPKSPEEMEASMVRNLKEKTGKELGEWIEIVRSTGLEKHGEIVKRLKSAHGVTHGYASLIAHHFRRQGSTPVVDLVTAQYAGPKEALRPIYDAVIARVSRFGSDIEVAPKKAYVSLRRNKQLAIIQPSTKTRVDVGINLKEVDPTDRLEASGSFNAMVSHRVRVTDVSQVDDELIEWLRKAYESA